MIISCVSCVQRSCLDLFIAMKCLVTHVENIPHICQINWEYIVNNIIYYILCILCATIALYLDLCFAMKCLVTHVEKTSALIAPVSAGDIGHYCKHHHSNAVISTCLWNVIRFSVFYFSEDLMGQLQARPLGNLLEWPPHGKNLSLTVQLKEMSAHLKIVRCADAVWWPIWSIWRRASNAAEDCICVRVFFICVSPLFAWVAWRHWDTGLKRSIWWWGNARAPALP